MRQNSSKRNTEKNKKVEMHSNDDEWQNDTNFQNKWTTTSSAQQQQITIRLKKKRNENQLTSFYSCFKNSNAKKK